MGGGRSQIRGGARVESQHAERIKWSELVQALRRIDRRGDPAGGASHSPQPSRSPHLPFLLPDWNVHLLQSHTDEAIVWLEKARSDMPPTLPFHRSRLASAYA